MAKKRKRTKKISKGLRPTINSWVLKATRPDEAQSLMNKLEAWREGKNPWITVANPNIHETNKRFIRIRANSYFGHGGSFKDTKNSFKRQRDGMEAHI